MSKMQVLEDLRNDRDQARNAALELLSSDDYDPNSDALKGLEERASYLDGQIERLVKVMDGQAAADALDGRMVKASRRADERSSASAETREHWADTFLRSEEFTTYAGRGTSRKFEVEMRALPHSLTSMGNALPSVPVYDLTPSAPPPTILPLTNQVSVSGNAVDYITFSKKAGAAAVVPEGTLKPDIEWQANVSSKSLVTIAGHTSFTRQLAQDSVAVRSYLTGELQNEVRRKIESEAVAALAAATLPTYSYGGTAGLLGAIRGGMAEVQANGFTPNGFLVNSDDLVDLDISVMTTAGTGPNRTNAYWGLTPIVDPNAVAGTVTVGDFRAGVTHYSRTAVELFLTDSHAANFTLNIIDAIAEARCLTVVTRPDALVEATAA